MREPGRPTFLTCPDLSVELCQEKKVDDNFERGSSTSSRSSMPSWSVAAVQVKFSPDKSDTAMNLPIVKYLQKQGVTCFPVLFSASHGGLSTNESEVERGVLYDEAGLTGFHRVPSATGRPTPSASPASRPPAVAGSSATGQRWTRASATAPTDAPSTDRSWPSCSDPASG